MSDEYAHYVEQGAFLDGLTKGRKESEKKINAMAHLLDEILDHALSNRGTPHEFFNCYTYAHGNLPDWVRKAKEMLGESHQLEDTNWKTKP